MFVSWRERLTAQPALWQFEQWPRLAIEGLPHPRRKLYLRNRQILAQVLAGQPLHSVARAHQLSPGRLTQLLNRCLGGEADTQPALSRGLVPYASLNPRQRCSPLPALTHHRPANCAFRALLQNVPGLQVGLDALIIAKLKDSPNAQSLTPQGFHGAFKRLLVEANWPADCYPYTSMTVAYESLRQYLHHREDELRLARQHRRNQATPATGALGGGTHARAMAIAQTDEHTLDLSNNVHLVLNDELIPLRLARACVLVTIDVATHCIFGYHLAFSRYPNQQDMLTLLGNCLTPWQPMALTTPGFSYLPGACFPSGLSDAFPISFGTMQLDNALMHRAHSVIGFLCEQQGTTLSYGHPATPTIRALVESVFHYIAKHATHRFAATSGSYPTDEKKESRKNQKRVPSVSLRTLDEALSILLTEYNVTPQAALGGATPLALFRHHCQNHFVRYVPAALQTQWRPLVNEKIVTLHWEKDAHRAPYVYFMYTRYQGPGLWQALPDHKKIRLHFDRRDIRSVQASTLDGDELGELRAPLSWQRFAHSIATRQLIHRLTKTCRFSMRDPLSAYFQYLLDNKNQPKTALQLLQVYEEYTQAGARLVLDKADGPLTPPVPIPNKKTVTWHSSTASHQE